MAQHAKVPETTARRVRDRQHLFPGRQRRLAPSFTETEHAELAAAAGLAGLTPSGFCAEAALAAARGETDRGPGSDREALRRLQLEVFAARAAVNRIGADINQVTAAFHAIGELPGYVRAATEICARAVARLDAVTNEIRRRLR